jgi:malic enzyme
MKIAVAKTLADSVSKETLCPEKIIPSVFEKDIAKRVANAVKRVYKNYLSGSK